MTHARYPQTKTDSGGSPWLDRFALTLEIAEWLTGSQSSPLNIRISDIELVA